MVFNAGALPDGGTLAGIWNRHATAVCLAGCTGGVELTTDIFVSVGLPPLPLPEDTGGGTKTGAGVWTRG